MADQKRIVSEMDGDAVRTFNLVLARLSAGNGVTVKQTDAVRAFANAVNTGDDRALSLITEWQAQEKSK